MCVNGMDGLMNEWTKLIMTRLVAATVSKNLQLVCKVWIVWRCESLHCLRAGGNLAVKHFDVFHYFTVRWLVVSIWSFHLAFPLVHLRFELRRLHLLAQECQSLLFCNLSQLLIVSFDAFCCLFRLVVVVLFPNVIPQQSVSAWNNKLLDERSAINLAVVTRSFHHDVRRLKSNCR